MCFSRRKKEENECVKKKLVFMCEKLLFMEKMCAKKEHGRKLCVASSCSGVHGRISMNKPLDSYFKYLFLSNPLLDLSQTLISFSLGGVECFFQNFSIVGFVARELHLLEVEGVELFVSFIKYGQNNFMFRGITLDLKNKNL